MYDNKSCKDSKYSIDYYTNSIVYYIIFCFGKKLEIVKYCINLIA